MRDALDNFLNLALAKVSGQPHSVLMTNQSTTKLNNVIAVEEGMEAGAITWWKMRGDVSCEKLTSAWKEAGFSDELLPWANTPGIALSRALRKHGKGRQLVRPLDETSSYAIVEETALRGELTHRTVLSVKIGADAKLVFGGSTAVNTPDLTPHDYRVQMRVEIETDYAHALTTYDHSDVSGWISGRLLPYVSAISLRPAGGVYFVPAGHAVETWRRMVETLRSVSQHDVYEVAALHTRTAVTAILAAVTREAEDAAVEMEVELIEKDLGVRALRNRVAKLDAITGKVSAYEGLLGSTLDELRARLEALNVQMAAAIFSTEAAADVEAGVAQ